MPKEDTYKEQFVQVREWKMRQYFNRKTCKKKIIGKKGVNGTIRVEWTLRVQGAECGLY
jgi:hypothetical protein